MAPRNELVEREERVVSALGVIAPPPIHVQTPTFDGSLAMLFRCVRDHRVDLLEVPLFPICEAYFAYLAQSAEANLDEAAAALAALAYLLERKAWLLLPVPEPEDPVYDEPIELPDPTVQEFGAAILALQHWHDERSEWFFRSREAGPDPYELPYELKGVSAQDLANALQRVLLRAKPTEIKPLGRARRILSDVMRQVLLRVGHDWRPMDALLDPGFTREDAVYTFLALLELVRLGQVGLRFEEEEVQFARA